MFDHRTSVLLSPKGQNNESSKSCSETIQRDLALKLANGFGASMGCKQEVCGAISGGILGVSLLYGRGEKDDRQRQELTYAKVRELIDKFGVMHGANSCRRLLDGCELMTPEG